MITQTELSACCNSLLRINEVDDPYCVNGVQVPSSTKVGKVLLGTTASRAFLKAAAEKQVNAVIVHHGLFWGKGVRTVDSLLAERLRLLLANNISLLGYHLPLDAHEELGNNAQIAKLLGAKYFYIKDICAVAELEMVIGFEELKNRCQKAFGQVNFAGQFTEKPIKKIGICSGGGADYANICFEEEVDAFIAGELSEQHWHMFAEMPLNFIAGGHHATERFGPIALTEHLQQKFPSVSFEYFTEQCPV
jgi:dinuclear metal center YbgI/SA1388 family protein